MRRGGARGRFGAHVGRRAALGRAADGHHLTEVDEGGGARTVDEDVLGLDVAVDEPAGMDDTEAFERAGDHAECLGCTEAPGLTSDRSQRGAVDVVHGEVAPSVLDPGAPHPHEMGVRERGEHGRLGLESFGQTGQRTERRVEDLDRDLLARGLLGRQVDRAGRAPSDHPGEAVGAEGEDVRLGLLALPNRTDLCATGLAEAAPFVEFVPAVIAVDRHAVSSYQSLRDCSPATGSTRTWRRSSSKD